MHTSDSSDWVTYTECKTFRRQCHLTNSFFNCNDSAFSAPSNQTKHWTYAEVSFFFLSSSPQPYEAGIQRVPIFDQQISKKYDLQAWWACPHFTDSKFIHPNKHEVHNLLDKAVLSLECQQQSFTL